MASSPASPPLDSAPARILDAAARRIAAAGVAAASLQEIAAEAGVSKALLLYHFRDKDALLAALVERLADHVRARERALFDGEALGPTAAIERLWAWVSEELARGELRVLLQLAAVPAAVVAAAVRSAARLRREEAAHTVERLFRALELRPRVPSPLLAEVFVAFLDGLALDSALEEREPRVAFDVLWLGLLSLAE